MWLPFLACLLSLIFSFLPLCITTKASPKDAKKGKKKMTTPSNSATPTPETSAATKKKKRIVHKWVCTGCQKVATPSPTSKKEQEMAQEKSVSQQPSVSQLYEGKILLADILESCTKQQKDAIQRLCPADQKAWYRFIIKSPVLELAEQDEVMKTHRCEVATAGKKSCEKCRQYREFIKDRRLKFHKFGDLLGEEDRDFYEDCQEELEWRLLSWGEVFSPKTAGFFKQLKPGKQPVPDQKKLKAIIKRYQEEEEADRTKYGTGYGLGIEKDPLTAARRERRELKQDEREMKQRRMEKGEREPDESDWKQKQNMEISQYCREMKWGKQHKQEKVKREKARLRQRTQEQEQLQRAQKKQRLMEKEQEEGAKSGDGGTSESSEEEEA